MVKHDFDGYSYKEEYVQRIAGKEPRNASEPVPLSAAAAVTVS
jgi:hypothetical protein